MTNSQENSSNKRIVKNTIFLYFRMILVMLVSLYTSRVILNSLGIIDYGLYNVVGGIVVMFSFLSGAMSGATSRYLSYELGKSNLERLKSTFSASLNIYIVVGFAILVFGELIGLWFLFNKLVLPPDRFVACIWVLQFSILTSFIHCIQLPFRSSIISHESLNIYAFLGIYEAVSKLIISYLIICDTFDRLIFYSALLFINQCAIAVFYIFYSRQKYIECRFRNVRDKNLYKQLTAYSGYDMIGSMSFVFQNQGLNMLLNVFFGPATNAARGVAVQINGACVQLVNNFLMAVRPQVIKKYAKEDYRGMYQLAFYASKFAFLLMFAVSFPLIIEIHYVLRIWLGDNVPKETEIFSRLILLIGLVQTFIYSMNIVMHAIGRLKEPSIVNSILYILPLILSYICFYYGAPAYVAYLIVLVVYCAIYANTLYWMYKFVNFDLMFFLYNVIFKSFVVIILTSILPLLVYSNYEESFLRFILTVLSIDLPLFLFTWLIVLKSSERKIVLDFLMNKLSQKK